MQLVVVGHDALASALWVAPDGCPGSFRVQAESSQRRPKVLADLALGRMRAKLPDLALAPERPGDHHAPRSRNGGS